MKKISLIKDATCYSLLAFLLMLGAALQTAHANEYIALGSVVTKVGNTAGNSDLFFIVVEGGSGPCVTTTIQNNIYFPMHAAGSEKIFDRAYSNALSALMSGKKVNIYNYVDGACDKAAFIEIMAN